MFVHMYSGHKSTNTYIKMKAQTIVVMCVDDDGLWVSSNAIEALYSHFHLVGCFRSETRDYTGLEGVVEHLYTSVDPHM